MTRTVRATLVVLTLLPLGACAGGPRQRPLPTKAIDQGPDTIGAARKQLQGEWTLLSLDVAAQDGRRRGVDAAGRLMLDDFGNLDIVFKVSEGGLETLKTLGVELANPTISTSGQAVIDPASHRVTYVPPNVGQRAFDPDLAAARDNPFALERVRYYALDQGVLTLTTRHDNGQDAITSRWRKVP